MARKPSTDYNAKLKEIAEYEHLSVREVKKLAAWMVIRMYDEKWAFSDPNLADIRATYMKLTNEQLYKQVRYWDAYVRGLEQRVKRRRLEAEKWRAQLPKSRNLEPDINYTDNPEFIRRAGHLTPNPDAGNPSRPGPTQNTPSPVLETTPGAGKESSQELGAGVRSLIADLF
jgi:hypothetical protein